ncbi:unnamed protein product [Closterium sp. NIES-65]|nr:unnamed protein product [Closterium sp. NIES-65]
MTYYRARGHPLDSLVDLSHLSSLPSPAHPFAPTRNAHALAQRFSAPTSPSGSSVHSAFGPSSASVVLPPSSASAILPPPARGGSANYRFALTKPGAGEPGGGGTGAGGVGEWVAEVHAQQRGNDGTGEGAGRGEGQGSSAERGESTRGGEKVWRSRVDIGGSVEGGALHSSPTPFPLSPRSHFVPLSSPSRPHPALPLSPSPTYDLPIAHYSSSPSASASPFPPARSPFSPPSAELLAGAAARGAGRAGREGGMARGGAEQLWRERVLAAAGAAGGAAPSAAPPPAALAVGGAAGAGELVVGGQRVDAGGLLGGVMAQRRAVGGGGRGGAGGVGGIGAWYGVGGAGGIGGEQYGDGYGEAHKRRRRGVVGLAVGAAEQVWRWWQEAEWVRDWARDGREGREQRDGREERDGREGREGREGRGARRRQVAMQAAGDPSPRAASGAAAVHSELLRHFQADLARLAPPYPPFSPSPPSPVPLPTHQAEGDPSPRAASAAAAVHSDLLLHAQEDLARLEGAEEGQSCWALHERALLLPPSPHSPSPALLSALRVYERMHEVRERGGRVREGWWWGWGGKCGGQGGWFPALLASLRAYERMHEECVAGVQSWEAHAEKLEAPRSTCSYLVWYEPQTHPSVAQRLLSLLSAFLYALLTHRALLVDTHGDLPSCTRFACPISTLSYPISTLSYPISTLSYPISTLSYPISTLSYPISTLSCPISTLACPISTLSYPISTLSYPISTLSYPISTLSYPISTLSYPISTLSYPISTLSYPISTLSYPISTLSYPISTLSCPISPQSSCPQSAVQPLPALPLVAARSASSLLLILPPSPAICIPPPKPAVHPLPAPLMVASRPVSSHLRILPPSLPPVISPSSPLPPSLLCNPFPRSSWWLPAGLPEHFRLHPPHQGEWVNGSTSNSFFAPLNRRDVATIYFEVSEAAAVPMPMHIHMHTYLLFPRGYHHACSTGLACKPDPSSPLAIFSSPPPHLTLPTSPPHPPHLPTSPSPPPHLTLPSFPPAALCLTVPPLPFQFVHPPHPRPPHRHSATHGMSSSSAPPCKPNSPATPHPTRPQRHMAGHAEQRYAWDEQFFCSSMQTQLARNATWLAMLCDQHLLPSLFLLPAFHRPLHRLFPSRVLLHPLARYLLLPANAVWERALRAHQGHLAHAWRSVGVQLASWGSVAMKEAMREQALECGMSHGVLPLPLAPSQLAAFLNHSSRARHLSLSSRSLLDGDREEGERGGQGEGQGEGKGVGKGEGVHKKAGSGGGSPQRRRFGLFSRPQGGEGRTASHNKVGKVGAGMGAGGQIREHTGETSSVSHDAAGGGGAGDASEGEPGSSRGVVRGRARARVVAVFVAADSFAAFKFFKRAYAQWPTEDHSVVAVHAEVEDDSEERLLSANQMEILRIWLLSTCHVIIASPESPEGYLASGLAGRPPFLLSHPPATTATTESHHGDPAAAAVAAAAAAAGREHQGGCTRSWSAEGCHLGAPLALTCSSDPRGDGSGGVREREHRSSDPARWLPFLRRCADHPQGLTLLAKLTHPDP